MDQSPYSATPPNPVVSAPNGHHPRSMGPLISIILGVLFIASLGGFIWAFSQYRTYKNDNDQITEEAVQKAEAAQKTKLEADFQIERDRLYNSYVVDPVLANVTLQYPRDWSFYLEQSTSSSLKINALFHPTVVAKADPGTYALRLQIVQDLYNEVVADYQRSIDRGELTATPIKSNDVDGLRLDGQIDNKHTGSLVILPIRDKTLILSTESNDYQSVFNDVLSKLVFTQ